MFLQQEGMKKKKSSSSGPDALSLLGVLQYLRNFPGCAGQTLKSELQLHVFISKASAGLSVSHAGAAWLRAASSAAFLTILDALQRKWQGVFF